MPQGRGTSLCPAETACRAFRRRATPGPDSPYGAEARSRRAVVTRRRPQPTRRIPRLTAVTVPETAPVDGQGPVQPVPDAQGLDAQAEERARAEARFRLRRSRVATAVVAGSLVVLVGVVALLGGFERRTDLLTPVEPGIVITTGPYEVKLASATLQHRTSADEWVAVVSGTALTTGATSIRPPIGSSGFLYARSAAGGEAQPATSITLGDPDSVQGPGTLTPGLPAVPWTVTFRFPTSPGDRLLVAVFEQEFTTPYLFSDEEGWRATSKASTMTLPLEQLPESKY